MTQHLTTHVFHTMSPYFRQHSAELAIIPRSYWLAPTAATPHSLQHDRCDHTNLLQSSTSTNQHRLHITMPAKTYGTAHKCNHCSQSGSNGNIILIIISLVEANAKLTSILVINLTEIELFPDQHRKLGNLTKYEQPLIHHRRTINWNKSPQNDR